MFAAMHESGYGAEGEISRARCNVRFTPAKRTRYTQGEVLCL